MSIVLKILLAIAFLLFCAGLVAITVVVALAMRDIEEQDYKDYDED